jgi:site-specific recombinase XerC
MLLNRALDDELIGRNPAIDIPAPVTDRARVRVLKPWELEAVAANLPERWRAFALLGAYASLRWSELVAVKRDDIDIEERTLRIDEKVVEVRGRFEWEDRRRRSRRAPSTCRRLLSSRSQGTCSASRLSAAPAISGGRVSSSTASVEGRSAGTFSDGSGIGRAERLGSRASGPSGSVIRARVSPMRPRGI